MRLALVFELVPVVEVAAGVSAREERHQAGEADSWQRVLGAIMVEQALERCGFRGVQRQWQPPEERPDQLTVSGPCTELESGAEAVLLSYSARQS